MKIVVVDTETTGLLPRDRTKLDEYPHIVQLSIRAYDTVTRAHSNANLLVKSPVAVPKAASKVHGISDEMLERDGVEKMEALLHLALALEGCDEIVGHNIAFDTAVLEQELNRLSLLNFLSANSIPRYCTMNEGRRRCKIAKQSASHWRGYYFKNPTLAELYTHMFGTKVDGLHDASVDTAVTLRCYLKMKHDINHAPQEFGIPEMF